MPTYIKGIRSREEIINKSIRIFNEQGIQITLGKLAELMVTSLGRLTHHFRNKDLLFLAIAKDYEDKLQELRKKGEDDQISIDSFITGLSEAMDLKFKYRCAMRYIVASLNSRGSIKIHQQQTCATKKKDIRKTIEAGVHGGTLQSRLLSDDMYDVFLFQLTNLFTNWVFNLELYDADKSYSAVKPTYMQGILSIFLPFLTDKGKQELEQNGIFKHSFQ